MEEELTKLTSYQYIGLLIKDKKDTGSAFVRRDRRYARSIPGGKILNDWKFVVNRGNFRIVVNKLQDDWFVVHFINYADNTSEYFKCDHQVVLEECLDVLLGDQLY